MHHYHTSHLENVSNVHICSLYKLAFQATLGVNWKSGKIIIYPMTSQLAELHRTWVLIKDKNCLKKTKGFALECIFTKSKSYCEHGISCHQKPDFPLSLYLLSTSAAFISYVTHELLVLTRNLVRLSYAALHHSLLNYTGHGFK